MMQLTFLGTGTSSGVPQLRCSCPTCSSSDPRDRRLRCSALLRTKGRTLLIDCGPDFFHQMLRLGSPDLDALLVTHSHYDHVGGVDDLRPYAPDHPVGFPVHCTADVAADLRRVMPYAFGDGRNNRLPHLSTEVFSLEPPEPFTVVGGIEVTPLPIVHNESGPLIAGFRIGKLAYVTDCKIMPSSTVELMKGVDTLVINALRHTPHPTHMNLRQALDVIQEVKPRKAYLTHLSHGIGLHRETSRLLPEGVEMARDFLSINIPE